MLRGQFKRQKPTELRRQDDEELKMGSNFLSGKWVQETNRSLGSSNGALVGFGTPCVRIPQAIQME